MPYERSLAIKEFFNNTDSMLSITRQAISKKTSLPPPTIEMIFQASIFKTCARLEEYIKNVICDWLFNAVNKKCLAGSLPEDLRWFFILHAHLSHYKQFINTPNEIKLINNLKGSTQNSLLDDQESIDKIINPMSVVGDRKYPSKKNIQSLFNRIGLPNIMNLVNKRTHRNHELLLQSFLDVREAIAHQAPPSLTYADVRTHIKNIRSFVGAIDRILYSHVMTHNGSGCWRTS